MLWKKTRGTGKSLSSSVSFFFTRMMRIELKECKSPMLVQLPLVLSTTFRRSRASVRPVSLCLLLFSFSQSANDYPSLWVHVDAAWAGVACSCPEYRELCHLDTINEFVDSFCTNWHKVGNEHAFSVVHKLTS